ncbi:hypothetical protein [Frigoribacterium sp. CG_9.8]|uniref:hypothetical protein n=1 Tax=Frigoribacterium sp. CG_9.8 TaxID=2787733 RepID=UPI0018C9EDCC|nr:hypothetical protein [Frigoribacterium sp. CG_9.8]MBG6107950.1 Tfp pilus assembly protein PilO [Frigoribacterium sp. CG_9.8]
MVAVMIFGWFLGVQPQLASTEAARQHLVLVRSQNNANSVSITQLKGDFDRISEIKIKLATMRLSVPSSAEISTLVTELDSLAGEHQIEVHAITVADALGYTPPSTAATIPADEMSVDPSSASTHASAGMPSTSTAAVPQSHSSITGANFIAIPVQLTVTGPFPGVLEFVHGLQTGHRLFLVTTMSTTVSPDKAAVELVNATVGGLVYVLLANVEGETGKSCNQDCQAGR